jgi:HAD superfamily hydrolase (TIGR01490 family)
MNDKRVLAVFDFDGTITKRDTLPVFIRFAVTLLHLLKGTIYMAPFVLLFKLKVIPNYTAKERLFKTFFKGISMERFNELSQNFITNIEQMVNPVALEKIKWHQQMGHEVIIISASVENWIRPWANKYGIQTVLATGLQLENNMITGNFLTKNCHGIEKVNRLLAAYPERDSYTLYAYGDSSGDKELLATAEHSFYRKF